jgi:hypothetical protein
LREVEQATAAKACELTDFEAAKVQEIKDLHNELQERKEELQHHEIELTN